MSKITVGAVLAALIASAPAWSQVSPAPDTGTADQGIGSRPIANVAANDTINGAPAVLGSSGNATVAKVGTWPAGIVLNPATGSVSTSTSLGVGQYVNQYKLCNLSGTCATTTTTVNVITAAIVANPESGTADAGIGSQPIANVTSNDTVNGSPVTLGTGGNATISKDPNNPPPTGIALNTSTGAITTSTTLAAGQYSVNYRLCDLNVPAQCATTTDSINVITPNIVANPDSGSAAAGVAARPIANVAANDTVNGAPATLGSGGNSTIAVAAGTTWPAGIVLNTATGAVSTAATVTPGSYALQYQLCDLNSPPACAVGNISLSIGAAIIANPDSGWAVTGNLTTVIGSVVANDTVNNAPATLGASGNATISQYGSAWPMGLALDTNAGAVSVTATLAPATYQVQYQLCDLNPTPDCAVGTVTVYITPVYNEVQATTTPMGDIEFDWGRDGLFCQSCNFGDGNARANWTDRSGNIWIAHLDPNTGQFVSPGANDESVANANAFFWYAYGNGPEWTFSTQNGQTLSQLVYSRYSPSDPNPPNKSAPGYTGAAFATQVGPETWSSTFFPGAINNGNTTPGGSNSNLPEGSQCLTDPVGLAMYKNFENPIQLFTEPLSTAKGTAPKLTPFTSNGIGERFVPCTHQLLFQANAPSGQYTFQQVFWYNIDTGVVEQLTTDQTTKYSGFMFKAPDFGDNYIFFTLANHQTFLVYQQTGTNADGSPQFTLVNSISSPDPNQAFMNTAEPFIVCTPACKTYIFTTVSKTDDSQNGATVPNGLAVIALSPNTPMFNILVDGNQIPIRQRLDPEYFITPNGAYLYYNDITPQTGSTTFKNNGEYFIDMQLGVPSGSCNGSSAEGGLLPGC